MTGIYQKGNIMNGENGSGGFSHYDLKKTAGGIGTTVLMSPSQAFGANPGKKSMSNNKRTEIETDVLVIGGGQAGVFAAVKARENGAEVTMAVKGTVGRSGLTPGANTFFIYDPSSGDDYDTYIKQFRSSGEYLNNMDWTEKIMQESLKTWEEFSSWGALTGTKSAYMPGTLTRSYEVVGFSVPLRKKAREIGVNILERVMITDLLMHEGRVAGAVGFSMNNEELFVIKAKAVCMCAGSGSFKPMGQFPCASITHDGDGMAYRVGAEISGKEFNDAHELQIGASPFGEVRRGKDKIGTGMLGMPRPEQGVDVDKDPLGFDLDMVYQAMRGEIPVVRLHGKIKTGGPGPAGPPGGGTPESGARPEGTPRPPATPSQYHPNTRVQIVLGGTAGMSNHKGEGLWPQDTTGASNVPGLFAAGDNMCSMQAGANYAGFGSSFCGSAVQGAAAGTGAAEYAKSVKKIVVSESSINKALGALTLPRGRDRGFAPSWVTQAMQCAVLPYYVLFAKEESRLQAALSSILHLKNSVAPLMIARDPHELRLAHETRNMLLNAEMKLKASIMRKESRGTHFREDYPARDDKNWLAWIKIKQVDGEMVLDKLEVPEAWKPDLNIPYEHRYPKRFPGEMEFIKSKKI